MSKHTPGPWEWDNSVSVNSGRNLVALIYSTPHKNTNIDANARLIAAAPELLEALQSLVDCITDTRGPNADAALHKARTVIAKAGGTP